VAAIESDNSIIATINRQSHHISPANITLSPSSVLAEIRWSYRWLVAADALVISLFYKAESRAGDLWDERAAALAQYDKNRWDISPADVRGSGSRFFKFQSRLLTLQDGAMLFGAYGLVALYVIFSLRDLRMLKSRVGLFLTVVVQVSASQDARMRRKFSILLICLRRDSFRSLLALHFPGFSALMSPTFLPWPTRLSFS
jgi:hypothetical protein